MPSETYGLTPRELRALRSLKTPARIQHFINDLLGAPHLPQFGDVG